MKSQTRLSISQVTIVKITNSKKRIQSIAYLYTLLQITITTIIILKNIKHYNFLSLSHSNLSYFKITELPITITYSLTYFDVAWIKMHFGLITICNKNNSGL